MYGNSNASNAAAYNRKAAYVVEMAADAPQPGNALLRLATQIEQATSHIEHIAGNLTNVATGIHGPSPEPVSDDWGGAAGNTASSDSFATRISHLLGAVERLQRSYESIVR